MKRKLVFFGNQASENVNRWLHLYALEGVQVEGFYSVHPDLGHFPGFISTYSRIWKPFRYFLLGAKLRLANNKEILLHAHGASGYGLAALLSGRPYIATVYGSEVLGKHGFAYRLLVKIVLRNAVRVTVTASHTSQILAAQFGVATEHVICFHTGLDLEKVQLVSPRQPSPEQSSDLPLRFLSVRNAAPHYRTDIIISTFLKSVGADSTLTVIQGNGDNAYFEGLRQRYGHSRRVHFIPGKLKHIDMLGLIRDHDACISFPISDQLSTSILESLYMGKVTISANLPVYSPLVDNRSLSVAFVPCGTPSELASAFSNASRLAVSNVRSCQEAIVQHYSDHSIRSKLTSILTELELR